MRQASRIGMLHCEMLLPFWQRQAFSWFFDKISNPDSGEAIDLADFLSQMLND